MPRIRVTSWFWNTSPRPGSATNTPIGSWSRVAASSCREWRSDWVSLARSRADEVASASARTYVSWDSSNGCGEAKPSVRQPIARPSRMIGTLADARWPSAMNAGAKSGQRCAAAARSGTSDLASLADRLDGRDRRVQGRGPRPRGPTRGSPRARGASSIGRPRPSTRTAPHCAPAPGIAARSSVRAIDSGSRSPAIAARVAATLAARLARERLGAHATQGLACEPAARLEERPVRVADDPLPRPREDDPARRHLVDRHPDRRERAAAGATALEAREARPDLGVGREHERLAGPAHLGQRVVGVDRAVEPLWGELTLSVAARPDDIEVRALGGDERDGAAVRPERAEHGAEHRVRDVLGRDRRAEPRREGLQRLDVSRSPPLVGHLVQRQHEAARRRRPGRGGVGRSRRTPARARPPARRRSAARGRRPRPIPWRRRAAGRAGRAEVRQQGGDRRPTTASAPAASWRANAALACVTTRPPSSTATPTGTASRACATGDGTAGDGRRVVHAHDGRVWRRRGGARHHRRVAIRSEHRRRRVTGRERRLGAGPGHAVRRERAAESGRVGGVPAERQADGECPDEGVAGPGRVGRANRRRRDPRDASAARQHRGAALAERHDQRHAQPRRRARAARRPRRSCLAAQRAAADRARTRARWGRASRSPRARRRRSARPAPG